ncbi:uncharacterized protein DUF4244 [Nocardia bhagyanarayanae]|uniref:Uncharacterized protein DUF4244 n=2 Tax=Nocardia bhagyanarayanae TaxID=1215925 RepID=A0A543F5Y6_9NOCA|nr:uncharacterized protein DUF4244 [Nocardia bhagyanarayanae]
MGVASPIALGRSSPTRAEGPRGPKGKGKPVRIDKPTDRAPRRVGGPLLAERWARAHAAARDSTARVVHALRGSATNTVSSPGSSIRWAARVAGIRLARMRVKSRRRAAHRADSTSRHMASGSAALVVRHGHTVSTRTEAGMAVSWFHSRRLRARVREAIARLQLRTVRAAAADDGMSTAEYAIGTIAAAAFGAVLYGVVTGDSIVDALTKIIDRALNTTV